MKEEECYLVIAEEDVDGGFGDAIPTESVVCAFLDKSNAELYVKKYSNPHIYDTPYDDLYTGGLYVKTVSLKQSAEEV